MLGGLGDIREVGRAYFWIYRERLEEKLVGWGGRGGCSNAISWHYQTDCLSARLFQLRNSSAVPQVHYSVERQDVGRVCVA